MDKQFKEDIIEGLTGSPKSLPSKYFYDTEGDRLFREIMELDEYYLTSCELEIFQQQRALLLNYFKSECEKFHLIEFGAGDAYKTRILLSYFLESGIGFEYNPIDISSNVINLLKRDLVKAFPGLTVDPINQEYIAALDTISNKDTCKKVVLFLGSNIGNFTKKAAVSFFRALGEKMSKGDMLLTGFDMKKDPGIILSAYNDKKGVTADFNINLLKRINRELGADFNIPEFYHYPVYDPSTGAAKSFLISRIKQKVALTGIPGFIHFEQGEAIYMEISQKYELEDISEFALASGFSLKQNFTDSRNYFVNSLWELN